MVERTPDRPPETESSLASLLGFLPLPLLLSPPDTEDRRRRLELPRVACRRRWGLLLRPRADRRGNQSAKRERDLRERRRALRPSEEEEEEVGGGKLNSTEKENWQLCDLVWSRLNKRVVSMTTLM